MGSQVGSFEEENPESLIGQGSLYSLTLDEVQNQLGNLGKPLESMNLDELLKSVDTGGSWSSPLRRQGSLTLSRGLSKKTVEEVWRNIQQENKKDAENRERNAPLGEMTLEDFLVKAGVVTESAPLQQQESAQWMQFQNPTVPEPPYQNNIMTGFMQGHPVQQSLPVADAAYPNSQMNLSPSSLMGTLSDTQTPGRKRVASGDVAEKTVERKQKRMIKNRESAARSRARRQAYTNELEIKVYHLEEENERLRKQKEVEKVLPCAPPPEPKSQLRRTSSASF
ncbi:ABSCISIC ACID-INSENSITIVE 5-like protein 2 [Populus alba x Populus x berolinensis]|nr:ABSCISIC ACID-INSENSITIVE 5-like protein 2 [Populus alba x Populus x berolinensis]